MKLAAIIALLTLTACGNHQGFDYEEPYSTVKRTPFEAVAHFLRGN